METAIERRPTYQWASWRDALLALSSARKGPRPRLARSRLWHDPGDRPPELEDFARLRVALTKLRITGRILEELVLVAKGRRKVGPMNTERVRIEDGLRKMGITAPSPKMRREKNGGWYAPAPKPRRKILTQPANGAQDQVA